MTLDQATELIRRSLILAMTISAPMLIIGLLVGISVSLLQAITQVQEQSLSLIPKIIAMVISAMVLMPWMSHLLAVYAAEMLTGAGVAR